jgi:hypothetical protein
MLPRQRGGTGGLKVHVVGRGVDDRLDLGIGENVLITCCCSTPIFCGEADAYCISTTSFKNSVFGIELPSW